MCLVGIAWLRLLWLAGTSHCASSSPPAVHCVSFLIAAKKCMTVKKIFLQWSHLNHVSFSLQFGNVPAALYETVPIHCIFLILATFSIHDCNRRIGLSVTFSDSACYWSVLKYLPGKQPARLGLCFEMLCPAKSQQARAPSQSYVPLSEFSSTSGTGSLQKYSVLKKSLAEGLLSSFKYFIKIPKWFF